MRKIFVCASTPYLSMHISYDCVFSYTSLKWWNLQMFFSFFFKFWLSELLGERGLNVQKMAQNNKKICLTSLLTSWLWFSVHICKMISPAIFLIFFKVWFLGFSKFINKCPKEIPRCAPHSWHLCDFFVKLWLILSQNMTCILVRQVISLKRNGGVISKIYCLILWSPICTPLILVSASVKMAGTSATVTYNSMRVCTSGELLYKGKRFR